MISYKTFTTEFDEIVDAQELFRRAPIDRRPVENFIGYANLEAYKSLSATYFNTVLPKEISAFAKAMGQEKLISIQNELAITLLVDHSGSLMNDDGEGSVIARLITENLCGALCLLGLKHEVLGFTTRSWQGGLSREKWSKTGKPVNPGRLCDLLHIIYRAFDDEINGPSAYLENLFRRDILKENIDGEAIEWAKSRLIIRKEKHKILIIISDGAPVDDSSIMENKPDFLTKHLRSVLEETKSSNEINVKGIGVNYSLEDITDDSITINNMNDFQMELFPFIKSLVTNV